MSSFEKQENQEDVAPPPSYDASADLPTTRPETQESFGIAVPQFHLPSFDMKAPTTGHEKDEADMNSTDEKASGELATAPSYDGTRPKTKPKGGFGIAMPKFHFPSSKAPRDSNAELKVDTSNVNVKQPAKKGGFGFKFPTMKAPSLKGDNKDIVSTDQKSERDVEVKEPSLKSDEKDIASTEDKVDRDVAPPSYHATVGGAHPTAPETYPKGEVECGTKKDKEDKADIDSTNEKADGARAPPSYDASVDVGTRPKTKPKGGFGFAMPKLHTPSLKVQGNAKNAKMNVNSSNASTKQTPKKGGFGFKMPTMKFPSLKQEDH